MKEFPKKYKILLFVVVGLICGIQFFSYRLGQKQQLRFHERLIQQLAYPLELSGRWVVDQVFGVWRGYFALVHLRRDYGQLTAEADRLRALTVKMDEYAAENARLRSLLALREAAPFRTLAARVVARGLSAYFNSVQIDKGKEEGLRPGMAVITDRGIVGQVVNVGPGRSEVLLLIDPTSSIDVLAQRTRARGILTGAGIGEPMEFKYLSKFEELGKGDLLVSSGLDGVYPKGLAVGTVLEAERGKHGIFYDATAVAPAADFDRLEELLVVVERPAVPPPPPAAGAKGEDQAKGKR